MTDAMIDKKLQLDKQSKLVLSLDDELTYLMAEAEIVRNHCDLQLKAAMPVFNDAIEGLMKITKSEINELRTITRPRATLKTLMTAVCIILKEKPTIVSNKATNYETKACYWSTAISSKVLGDRNLIHRMTQIDPKSIDIETMKQLESLLQEEHIDNQMVNYASTAAKGMFAWIMAVRNYFYIYYECEPTRDKLIMADLQIESIKKRQKENKK